VVFVNGNPYTLHFVQGDRIRREAFEFVREQVVRLRLLPAVILKPAGLKDIGVW
jgi:hypothetical protein